MITYSNKQEKLKLVVQFEKFTRWSLIKLFQRPTANRDHFSNIRENLKNLLKYCRAVGGGYL